MGRPRLGRGAFEPRARGDENQGKRNDFLRFQEQLLRRKKQELFLVISVGNGLRGGITLQAKNHGFFLPTNLTNFRANECRTELVRVMPSAAENVKEIYTNLVLCI